MIKTAVTLLKRYDNDDMFLRFPGFTENICRYLPGLVVSLWFSHPLHLKLTVEPVELTTVVWKIREGTFARHRVRQHVCTDK